MYFNINLDSTINKDFSIEPENVVICKVLLSRYMINIDLSTTLSQKNDDISF